MKAIVCELCGSRDFLKQDGVFICQGCGTKYSIEEARKMMQEVEEDGVHTTTKNDNETINNFLELAQNALSAENNKEAESYANKIIEQAPHHYLAWKVKGCAAYRKDPFNALGFKEAMSAWNKAAQYCDEEKQEDLINEINKEIKDAANLLLFGQCKAFIEKPNESFRDGLLSTLYLIVKSINDWIVDQNTLFDMNDMLKGFSRSLANTGTQGFQTLKKACNGHYQLLDRQANMLFRKCGMAAIDLLQLAFKFSRDTDDSQTILHEQQKIADVLLNQLPMQKPNDLGSLFRISAMKKEYDILPAKRRRISLENQKSRIIELCVGERIREEKQAAKDQYWMQHKDEKEKLQHIVEESSEEKNKLDKQLEEIDSKLSDCRTKLNQKTEAERICAQIESEIASMQSELSTLGLFKGKRKKELAVLIEQKQGELASKKSVATSERNELEQRIKTETDELKQSYSKVQAEQYLVVRKIEKAEAELDKDCGTIPSGNPYYIEGSTCDGKFVISAKEYAEKMWKMLDSTYPVSDEQKRIDFREVEEEGLQRKIPHIGKYYSLGFRYVYLVDQDRVDEAIKNGEELFLDFDVVEYAKDENASISAIVIELDDKHPSDLIDVRLKGYCELGAAVLCSFIEKLSPTEAIKIMADMLMTEGTQVFERDGITATFMRVACKDYTSTYERRLLVRCK